MYIATPPLPFFGLVGGTDMSAKMQLELYYGRFNFWYLILHIVFSLTKNKCPCSENILFIKIYIQIFQRHERTGKI